MVEDCGNVLDNEGSRLEGRDGLWHVARDLVAWVGYVVAAVPHLGEALAGRPGGHDITSPIRPRSLGNRSEGGFTGDIADGEIRFRAVLLVDVGGVLPDVRRGDWFHTKETGGDREAAEARADVDRSQPPKLCVLGAHDGRVLEVESRQVLHTSRPERLIDGAGPPQEVERVSEDARGGIRLGARLLQDARRSALVPKRVGHDDLPSADLETGKRPVGPWRAVLEGGAEVLSERRCALPPTSELGEPEIPSKASRIVGTA